jgi:hypothetical protein
MIELYNDLPLEWLAIVVFLLTYLITGMIYWLVIALAVGERARAFKAISPGMLPPLGIIFGLFVAFIASQVWNDFDRANAAVDREASALRAVVLLAASFPGETEMRLRTLIHRHIEDAVKQEWPAMARQHATLTMIPAPLVEALQLSIALEPQGSGQTTAQREIILALQNALDARRQRIMISQITVDAVKWTGLLLQAVLTLVAIAMVHTENRRAAGIALALFATGIAVSIVLIVSHDRPFKGKFSVRPDVLLQVMPEGPKLADR